MKNFEFEKGSDINLSPNSSEGNNWLDMMNLIMPLSSKVTKSFHKNKENYPEYNSEDEVLNDIIPSEVISSCNSSEDEQISIPPVN